MAKYDDYEINQEYIDDFFKNCVSIETIDYNIIDDLTPEKMREIAQSIKAETWCASWNPEHKYEKIEFLDEYCTNKSDIVFELRKRKNNITEHRVGPISFKVTPHYVISKSSMYLKQNEYDAIIKILGEL